MSYTRRLATVVIALSGGLAGAVSPPAVSTSRAASVAEPPNVQLEAPRVRSMLEHGWAAESGEGQQRNAHLAAYLYCQAARAGSAEGHYRAGRVMADQQNGDGRYAAAFFLSTAVELGHGRAIQALDQLVRQTESAARVMPGCLRGDPYEPPAELARAPERELMPVGERAYSRLFDLEAYVAALKPERKQVAALVAMHAKEYGIDTRLALAIASVESNFDPTATSPKNARGVMQLIPETAKRFNVRNPYDAAQSIKGGLAYLRWLSDYFAGDLLRVIAAYNAGEGAVKRYNGVPPFDETRLYVRRVMELAGLPQTAGK